MLMARRSQEALDTGRRELQREVDEQYRRKAGDARERGTPARPMAYDADTHGPPEYQPRQHPPHHLGGIDRRATRIAHAEPEQHAERHRREPEDEGQVVQLVQSLERREQPEHLPEALGLELAKL